MISVIISTYKNTELFLNNLKHNLQYLQGCEIIIVNDDPTTSINTSINTSIKKYVALSHGREKVVQNLVLVENKKNLGFGESINMGVKKAKGEYLMLLNNDVLLSNNNYQLAINHFRNNPSLFAVSFAQKEKDGTVVGKNHLYWRKGFYQHERIKDNIPGENGWAEGGSCLIDKKKFLALGGFDKIYAPFYWEDIDLSQRARKKGWSIIFNPKIEVIHHHESTIGKYYDQKKIEIIAFRNQLIFTWKNLTNFNQKIEHYYYLFIFLIKNIMKLNFHYLKAFIQAVENYIDPETSSG